MVYGSYVDKEWGGHMMRLLKIGVHYYVAGLIVLTLGIALAIQSRLGTSPFDALLVGLFRTFGLSIGSWEVVAGLSLILGNALVERKRPEFFALMTSLITGIGIDTWLFLLRDIVVPGTWIGQWFCLILSLILSGMGIALYLQSNVAPNPVDRSMLIIANITGWNLTYSRAAINVLLVIVAFLFSGAIGIGTLFNALFSGVFIHYLSPKLTSIRNLELEKLGLKVKKA